MWAIAEFDERSTMGRFSLFASGGEFLVLLIGALGIAGMFDVLINDLLPDNFRWRLAFRHRHLILVGLAFCYVATFYISITEFKSFGLNLFALWNAVSLLSLAYFDAYARNREQNQARRARPA